MKIKAMSVAEEERKPKEEVVGFKKPSDVIKFKSTVGFRPPGAAAAMLPLRRMIIGIVSLVGGIIAGVVIALPLNTLVAQMTGAAVAVFAFGAVIEEAAKPIGFIIIAKGHPEWLTRKDGLRWGALAGLGFAVIENVIYFIQYPAAGVVLLRTVISLPLHVGWSAAVGLGIVYYLKERKAGELGGLFTLAVITHWAFNYALYTIAFS